MSQTARLWKGAGSWTLGSVLLLSGALARGAEPSPLSEQLVNLGNQALAQGRPSEAQQFFRQALKLDANNAAARRALASGIKRVSYQEPAQAAPAAEAPKPADDTPAPPEPAAAQPESAPKEQATIEHAMELEKILVQQLTADVNERLQKARDLLNQGNPESALETLRLALTAIQSSDRVPAPLRDQLSRQVQVQYRASLRRGEQIELDRAQLLQRQAASEQRERALATLASNEDTANLLMVQFASLMKAGMYNVMANGGMGDILEATAPFYEARLVAQKARALEQRATAPRAGVLVSQNIAFLAQ